MSLFGRDKLVQIIAYCVMPTHIHFALKQLKDAGISLFMGNIQNSYARYFNIKYNRKGPLWESKFKAKRVNNDEQLLHLTRYIHLNPVTAGIVDNPADWAASSYAEYLKINKEEKGMCEYSELIDFDPDKYKEFVDDRISYQRELAEIKHLICD